jgi:hypothetical protein
MDVTKLAIEKTNNCEQIIAFHQQAFHTFNQCLVQFQNLSSTKVMGMATAMGSASIAANAIANDLAPLESKALPFNLVTELKEEVLQELELNKEQHSEKA